MSDMMMNMMSESRPYTAWVIAAYCTVFAALSIFALYACWAAYRYEKNLSEKPTTEDFITARGSQSISRIAFSFYAGTAGAWVVVVPGSFAVEAGFMALCSFSISVGLGILMVAWLGPHVTKTFPEALSLSHFLEFRFGRTTQLVVVAITVINMAIFLLGELCIMGSLFKDYVGTTNLPIVIFMGVLTMAYTAYGGLRISIVTDRVQAIMTILLLLVLVTYLAAIFRPSEPKKLTGEDWGLKYTGYSSLFTMPLTLCAPAMFNEALWQRVWASKDTRSLRIGASAAAGLITVVIFVFGLGGFLAYWSQLAVKDVTNPNLYFFALFSEGESYLHTWAGLVTLLIAATMSEAGVDSLQNGINAAFSSSLLKDKSVYWSRLCVVIVNVVLIVIAVFAVNSPVLNIYLIGTMLTVACVFPILSGFITGPFARTYITQFSVLVGMWSGIVVLSLYGIGMEWDTMNCTFFQNVWNGIVQSWYNNMFGWDYYMVTIGGSIVGQAVAMVFHALGRRLFMGNTKENGSCGESASSNLHAVTVQIPAYNNDEEKTKVQNGR